MHPDLRVRFEKYSTSKISRDNYSNILEHGEPLRKENRWLSPGAWDNHCGLVHGEIDFKPLKYGTKKSCQTDWEETSNGLVEMHSSQKV